MWQSLDMADPRAVRIPGSVGEPQVITILDRPHNPQSIRRTSRDQRSHSLAGKPDSVSQPDIGATWARFAVPDRSRRSPCADTPPSSPPPGNSEALPLGLARRPEEKASPRLLSYDEDRKRRRGDTLRGCPRVDAGGEVIDEALLGRGTGAQDFASSALALELQDPSNASAGVPGSP